MAAKQKGRLEKLLKSALSYLTKWKIAKDRIYSSLKLMKNLTEQRESVATALEDQEDFCKYFPDLSAKTAQKLQEEIERSLVVIEESRVAMSETAGIFENQSRKAHQVLNALVQTGPPEETLYLHSALSFSVIDQAEWIKDLAFICTKEYPVNILVLSLSVFRLYCAYCSICIELL
jgi:ElaB/YqjD/DUF883 family membrane-anchored ribosome-binding protein